MCCGNLIHTLNPLTAAASQRINDTAAPVGATSPITCLACGAVVSPEFVWCPKCGQALKAHPCAYCRQMMDPSDNSCNYCGAPAKIY